MERIRCAGRGRRWLSAIEMLREAGFDGSGQGQRIEALARVLRDHPEAVLVQCADENTGIRFGAARCRVGRCEKIGSTTYRYQLWASWAPHDTGEEEE